MRRVAILLALIGAAACNRQVERVETEFPVPPALSAETSTPCPPAEPVTGGLGDLATKDAGLAIQYARCQARAAAAVGAYETTRRLLQAASDAAVARNAVQGVSSGGRR